MSNIEKKMPLSNPKTRKTLNVLVVDDESAVHVMTSLVLKNYEYEGYSLKLFDAYSVAEAREMLSSENRFALIILDVIMETDDAGLTLVQFIREELKDFIVRIILRTGQAGMVPERQVIRNYQIDDYKEKSELTNERFDATITAAIRTFLAFRKLEDSRQGIMRILDTVQEFERFSIEDLMTNHIFDQVRSVLGRDSSSDLDILLIADNPERTIISEDGFSDWVHRPLANLSDSQSVEFIKHSIESGEEYRGDYLITLPIRDWKGKRYTVCLSDIHMFGELEVYLLRLYLSQINAFLDNKSLTREIFETQEEIINTLGEVIETRSGETGAHVRRVKRVTRLLAESLGFEPTKSELLISAAPLHDIGKVGISDVILNKPGKLNPEELALMRTHAEIGYQILKSSKRSILKTGAQICLEHHEWWNGKGYPKGLSGDQISLEARICSIADVLDALQSKRVYKDAMPLDKALNIIEDGRGTQFDPALVDILMKNKNKIKLIYQGMEV